MLKKDITFIYMDSAEKLNYLPIAEEAQRRGYKVEFTQDKFKKCEIGIYCQHINFPQYSNFSVIMLHDIIQQYGSWPNIWIREPWNKYDVGVLPSYQWEKNWIESSKFYYARPRKGVYRVGWPKADTVAGIDRETYKKYFNTQYHLDGQKKTILYAPAWENDNKQDDFVQAMLALDVNILIKQYNATPEKYPEQYAEITRMRKLHEGNPRVVLLDTAMNIFDAILASDVLVSEESSTMAEATMMGIPAVSVSDWLIPDVTPSRYPDCNYEFVVMTTKARLRSCISDMIAHYDEYKRRAEAYRDVTFLNFGKTASIIMDIIDDCVDGKAIRHLPLTPQKKIKLNVRHYLKHKYIIWNREIRYNYCERSKVVAHIWAQVRRVKQNLTDVHIK